ncbi:MAG: response regulator transcription factor [Terriglobales bacterium]
MSGFRILVADDHPVFRFGLCSLLRSHGGWEVCGEAIDGRDTVQKCQQLKPDLVILDIGMPKLNGAVAARQIMKDNPAQRVLILTDVDSEQVIRDCVEGGVRGWVFKSDGTADLIGAVEALQHWRSSFTARVSELILDGYLHRHRVTPTLTKVSILSLREREVLQLLAEGKTTKEVAVTLNISTKTAETHRSNMMVKLRLHSIVELVLYAVRNQIIHVQIPALRLPDPANGRASGASQGLD